MFRLLSRDASDLEEEDLRSLIINGERLVELVKSVVYLIKTVSKKSGDPIRKKAINIEIRRSLRGILILLHAENVKAKDTIKQELARERGEITLGGDENYRLNPYSPPGRLSPFR